MKNSTVNALLLSGFILPLVLLLWPFAYWADWASLVFRVISALSVQALLCRIGKYPVIKAVPLIISGGIALWGTYLYFTSPHWSNATPGMLVSDYVSMFIACAIVCGVCYANSRRKAR